MYLIKATRDTALICIPRHTHMVGARGVEFFKKDKGMMIRFLTSRSYIAFRELLGGVTLLTPRDHACRRMHTLRGREIQATAYDNELIAWHKLTMDEWAIVSSPWKLLLDYAKPSHIVKLSTTANEAIIDTITLDYTHQFLILNPYQIHAELTIPVLGGWHGAWAAYELLSWEGMPVLRYRPELKSPDTTLALGYTRDGVPAGLLYKEQVLNRETLLTHTFIITIKD